MVAIAHAEHLDSSDARFWQYTSNGADEQERHGGRLREIVSASGLPCVARSLSKAVQELRPISE
jgi:hypothetical protein